MPPAVLFDDDDDANLVVRETACAEEFDVICANGAQRALELIRERTVAVIIADCPLWARIATIAPRP